MTTEELLENAWGIIANAQGGDWKRPTGAGEKFDRDWAEAAEKWRDAYHARERTGGVSSLTGTLLLPIETVKLTGNLCPLLALMLRAAGMDVLVVGNGDNLDHRAAALNLPFTGSASTQLTGKLFQQWKHGHAMRLLQNGPVLWPDAEFAQWAGPDCSGVKGLTVVNIGALLSQGLKPVDVGVLPG